MVQTRQTDRAIAEIAARQHGLITRTQLLSAGVSGDTVRWRVRVRRLEPVQRGVYRAGSLSAPREREMAAVLACGTGSVLSHWSAAGLWRACGARDGAEPVEVTVACLDRGRRPGIRAHRVGSPLRADDVTELDGIPVTSLARTVFDLAGQAGQVELRRLFARAARTRGNERDHGGIGCDVAFRSALSELLERHPRRPGAPLLRALLEDDIPPTLTRSEAEERVLRLIAKAQLPRPEVNAWIERCEVDFLWRAEGLVLEVDGFAFHASRESFESDRYRDAKLVAVGLRVMRVTWRQITSEPEAMLVRLGQALAPAGVL